MNAVPTNRQGHIKWLKWLVVLGALAATGLRIGLWSIDSSPTPQADKLPARPPIALADLKDALDAEFAPVVKDGLLRESTGCGVAIGVIDHGLAARVYLRRCTRRFYLPNRLGHQDPYRACPCAACGAGKSQARRAGAPDPFPRHRCRIACDRNHPARPRDSSLGASRHSRQPRAQRSRQSVCRL